MISEDLKFPSVHSADERLGDEDTAGVGPTVDLNAMLVHLLLHSQRNAAIPKFLVNVQPFRCCLVFAAGSSV